MNEKLMLAGVLVMSGLLVAGVAGATTVINHGCDGDCEPSPTPTVSPTPAEQKENPPGDEQDCETSTNVDACGEGYTNEEPETPAPVGKVKGVAKKATPTPTTTPAVEQKIEKLPEAGASLLLPLLLAGSWFAVAGVGFSRKW